MSRTMKDSGILWIGEIPSHWQSTSLLRLLRGRITDGPHETPVLQDKGIPFISVDSLNETDSVDLSGVKKFISRELYEEYQKKSNLEEGDILFSKAATIGKTAIVKKEVFMVWSPLAIIKPSPSVCFNKYLYYILNCKGLIIHVSLLGTYNTQINVGMRALEKAKVPFPPLEEQKRIAYFLDKKCGEIDEMISLQEKIIEELAVYKQAIITETVCRGLIPDVILKDSGIEWIDRIPYSWRVCKVKNVLSLLTDYDANGSFADLAKNVRVNEGEPYAWLVRATDLANNRYGIVEGNNYCDKATFDYLKKTVVHSGDVLIAKRGEIGKVYIVPQVDCKMSLAPNTYLLILNERIDNRYLFFYLSSDLGKKQLELNNKSTAIGAIYKDDVKDMCILLPDRNEQKSIADYLDIKCGEIDALISLKQSKIDALKEYKKSIIYEYITGKKEVPYGEQ